MATSWIPIYDVSYFNAPFSDDTHPDGDPTSLGDTQFCKALIANFVRAYGVPKADLCRICEAMFVGERKNHQLGGEAVHSLGQSLAGLIVSARGGCSFCRLLWGRFAKRSDCHLLCHTHDIKFGYAESRVGDSLVFTCPYADRNMEPLTTSIGVKSVAGMNQTFTASILRHLAYNIEATAVPRLQDVQSSTNCLITVLFAKYWIDDCSSNHALCKRSMPEKRSMPTRLIDLGQDSDIRPKLCKSTNLLGVKPYTTLSHCWGGFVPPKLLSTNIHGFERQMSIDELPKTFKDAMEFTKRLRINYIWIDSLCIVQDSEVDWLIEVSRMGEYYHNSTLNIAASEARNSLEGCFSSRNLADVEPCRVNSNWQGHGPSMLHCFDLDMLSECTDNSLLMKRAWAVQECAMAPRVVYFSSKQVFWRCLERRASESFPDGIPDNHSHKLSIDPSILDRWLLLARPGLERFQLWERIVNDYSKGDLTFKKKDKLIAISGLAKKLGSLDDYAAGLWRSHLADQLLWYVDSSDKHPRARRSEVYRAPSWSWASIDGPVRASSPINVNPTDIAIQILDVHIEPAPNHDEMGQIQEATLQLKGTLAYCRLIVKKEPTLEFRGGNIYTHQVCYEEPKQWIVQTYIAEAHTRGAGSTKSGLQALANVKLDSEDVKNNMIVYCLLVRSSHRGLLLTPTPSDGEYSRIGWFDIFSDDYENFMSICRNSSGFIDTGRDLYQWRFNPDRHGLPQYMITIV